MDGKGFGFIENSDGSGFLVWLVVSVFFHLYLGKDSHFD